jgi:hypothetical protein
VRQTSEVRGRLGPRGENDSAQAESDQDHPQPDNASQAQATHESLLPENGLRQTGESSLSRLKPVFLHRHYTEGTTR